MRRSGREPEDCDACEDCARGAVRVRVRAKPPPQARNRRAQGQHPEAGRRPLPRDVHAGRQGVRSLFTCEHTRSDCTVVLVMYSVHG